MQAHTNTHMCTQARTHMHARTHTPACARIDANARPRIHTHNATLESHSQLQMQIAGKLVNHFGSICELVRQDISPSLTSRFHLHSITSISPFKTGLDCVCIGTVQCMFDSASMMKLQTRGHQWPMSKGLTHWFRVWRNWCNHCSRCQSKYT